ncbi:hypothetical protein [Planomonospora parontospora]|uniref:hypothetical protein n=1 Tax=Planomonospora parontospora TaxID=58119 RepID=UPI0019A1B3DD|nr:hypothetical protein [Planomonospora parontospora]GGL35789.1 hypothetical protein GCM10014719_41260 [Planomonospora parontospora subsp. antibiotica]GII17435.1 hypothetical protein Ppa05_41610 [Planomonospora parontospora subsp. antibiotica]
MENVNWQSVFFINVPVGIIALVVGLLVIRESRADSLSRVGWLGVVLLSGAMFCLIWAIIKAPEDGWGDTRTLAFLAGAAVLGASPLAGSAISRFGPKVPIAVGMLITASAMFLLSRLGLEDGYVASAIPFVLLAGHASSRSPRSRWSSSSRARPSPRPVRPPARPSRWSRRSPVW